MKFGVLGKDIATALLALLFFAPASLFAEVRAIEGFALTVADTERAAAFYEGALGFKKVSERVISDRNYDHLTGVFGTRVKSVMLRLGADSIELDQFVSPAGQPIPRDSRSNDLWFQHMAIVVSDMDQAYRHLQNFPTQAISDAPQTIPESNPPAAGIKAFKFKDPDGHPLELLYFPPGKGRAKWHKADGRLFLGIDHSAITVSDTERSLSFYRDVLGLAVAGGSLNSGATQEHLDNARGAVVRVTALRPTSPEGPGLEFLQYLTPGGGRPIPVTMQANDIAHVHAVLEVDDMGSVVTQLQRNNVSFISPDVVSVNSLGYSKGLMVKDPDGHVLLLIQH
jgi:catechol 2,3-dioxygenase-like lactoylglutathione lyase family enzyme